MAIQQLSPIEIESFPKGICFFSTEQLINKFQSFVPEGILTTETIYQTLTCLGFELAEIKPFSYVWVMQS